MLQNLTLNCPYCFFEWARARVPGPAATAVVCPKCFALFCREETDHRPSQQAATFPSRAERVLPSGGGAKSGDERI
jgi:hypothetical protein